MPKWRNATLFLPPINMHQSWMARCVSCWFSCASHTVSHAVLLQSQWLMEEIEWWGACACRPVGFSSSAHKLSETVCCSDSHASVLQHLFIYSWRNSTLWRISFCLVTHVSKHRAFTSPRLNYIVNSNSSQRNVPFQRPHWRVCVQELLFGLEFYWLSASYQMCKPHVFLHRRIENRGC